MLENEEMKWEELKEKARMAGWEIFNRKNSETEKNTMKLLKILLNSRWNTECYNFDMDRIMTFLLKYNSKHMFLFAVDKTEQMFYTCNC